jgi:hypothetical protein
VNLLFELVFFLSNTSDYSPSGDIIHSRGEVLRTREYNWL